MTVTVNGPKTATRRGTEFSLEGVSRTAKRLPNRLVLHALEGWGKTSFAAQAPSPIFLLTKRETGLWKLMETGQVPETVPHFPKEAESWLDVKVAMNELIVKDHDYRTFILDSVTGAENLLHQWVCEEQFDGNWGEKGFGGFDRGGRNAAKFWPEMLDLMDRLRDKGMSSVLICHSKVFSFKNPEGADYDRWVPSVHKDSWEHLKQWADLILFGGFETFVDTKTSKETKGKAKGGQQRMLYTVRHAAYDAKNRHGLPDEIEGGSSAEECWQNFITALKGGK